LEAQSVRLEEKVAEGNQRLDQAQAKLLQSEKLASIGQLAAGVAHEINNPIGFVKSNLGTLQGYIDDLLRILDQYQELEPLLPGGCEPLRQLKEFQASIDFDFIRSDVRGLIAQSQDGIARVAKIIQDLKAFARSDTNQNYSMADLQACIESALNIAFNEIKYKADVLREYGGTPAIECIPAQLGQVFLNLLVNAAQAIDDKNGRGTITVRTGMVGADHVLVEIQDNGCGMPEDVRQRIFDPFFTTKPVGVGTGLGLSISYGIVHRHGGTINVASTPGGGSVFRIELPIRQEAATAEQ
jgi:signal transduction histidine kinase